MATNLKQWQNLVKEEILAGATSNNSVATMEHIFNVYCKHVTSNGKRIFDGKKQTVNNFLRIIAGYFGASEYYINNLYLIARLNGKTVEESINNAKANYFALTGKQWLTDEELASH